MQLRFPLKLLLVRVVLGVVALFSAIVFSVLVSPSPNQINRVPPVFLPVRLTIPQINVDTAIDSIGITPTGAMEAPVGPYTVGWFELGTRPGDIGSAVISGHYGPWKNGDISVFNDLHTLTVGDKMYIEDESGVLTMFVVRSLETYDLNADASPVFSSRDGKAHLNLITCQGVWNSVTKTYSNRLVVFTDREYP